MTRTGHYAIRALIELHRFGTAVPSARLAAETGIPQPYLRKVMAMFVRAGIVESRRGHNGGFRLRPDGATLQVAKILEVVQEPVASPAFPDRLDAIVAMPRTVFAQRIAGITLAELGA